ncbi:MAG: hypothetical protein KDD46_01120 [Bdellovibrionales bacterium]|nr:hypothetical protein [Bdellovibrionales bacterium]
MNQYIKIMAITFILLLGVSPLSYAQNQTKKKVVKNLVPTNLKRDLPAYQGVQYGCQSVPANPNGGGCLMDNDLSDMDYTPPATTGTPPATTGTTSTTITPGGSGITGN